ncbi:PTS transporter subunit EIIC [Spiroplasma melliferum]|uniref:PTS sugar transporter subunit IIC n=2 Tax=Spiroplasma melliferum TaxID=2134 RepID=A0AAI9X103_SPIME|nr:PTS transporter subunit EIIC [Spiroplasma melliferum]ELL44912.1 PTS system IIBC component [Spiroplasma melliferum IPMB4A]KAI92677.1 PTS sugar transporter subunit IIC [Spiroplasma melliferum KC3]
MQKSEKLKVKENYFMKLKNKIKAPFEGGKNSRFKIGINKFAKAILTMIAILPVAGLFIVVGKIIGPLGLGQITAIAKVANHIGTIIETIGWMPFRHIGLLFAIAIGGSWAKNKAGGCFAGAVAYLTLLSVGATFFITRNGPDGSEFMNYILGAKWTNQKDYFSNQEGVYSLRFDALGGIITGFIGAGVYNKFFAFNRLPNALAFFNGPRFVPLMVIVITLPIALGLSLLWPLIQTGINVIGKNIALNNKIPFIIPFGYGFLERLLLPFGLHHMITIPMNYTSLGGVLNYMSVNTYADNLFINQQITKEELVAFFTYVTENNLVDAKSLVSEGQEQMWYTWVSALNVVRNHWTNYASNVINSQVGVNNVYQITMNAFEPVRFKVGQMITSTGSLIGAGIGMMYAISKTNRIKYKSIYISGGLACLLTGVTEPIEFIFMYTAPLLYLVHAIMTGLAFGMADLIPMRIHAFGAIEIIMKYFLVLGPTTLITDSIKTNLWLDGCWFLLVSALFCTIYFILFYGLTKKLKPNIPGVGEQIPLDGYSLTEKVPEGNISDEVIHKIVSLLGTAENIEEVDCCMTRLRVVVKDDKKVSNKFKEETKALGVIKQGNYYQIVYGPKVSIYKEKIDEYLDNQIEEGHKL